MDPYNIITELWRLGIRVRLDGERIAVPARSLTTAQRDLLIAHKAELVEFLRQAHLTAAHAVEAALLACDHWQDGEAAREQMRRECAEVPPHLQADLLRHFQQAYGRPQRMP